MLSAEGAFLLLEEALGGAWPGLTSETREKLRIYADLLVKWNKRINLVGPATLGDVWRRHIADSAQLMRWISPQTKRLADLGSGAGLPGLILAILGVPEVHLIESDARKCAFLNEAARATDTKPFIHPARIEASPIRQMEIVTARALAPLSTLIPLAGRLLADGGKCLFLKGKTWQEEIVQARTLHAFDAKPHPSLTEDGAIIIELAIRKR